MRLVQFVHTLNYGDAISGEAVAIDRLARARGIQATIFAIHAHEKMQSFCKSLRELSDDNLSDGARVLLHYSLGSPLNKIYSEATGCQRALVYHNLTPPEWFYSYNPRVALDLEQGMGELSSLLKSSDLVIADSSYNAQEVYRLAGIQAEILPLPLDTVKWGVAANPGIAAALKGHGGKNLLHVGRLAPNKCIEDIIKAFYFYHHKIEKKSRLWLVGIDIDTEIYSFELRRLVSELRLEEVVQFVGAVSDGELKSFYQNSDCYLCMSEHEGFCVPLLEAMHFCVPIIAFNSSAVGETLGEAGLLVQDKEHSLIAELIAMLIEPGSLRDGLIKKGQQRVEQFSLSTFEQQLESMLFSADKSRAVRAI